MAITRYSTNSDMSAIKAALDASGLFGAISVEGRVLTIHDGNDNAVITITQGDYYSTGDMYTIAITDAGGTFTYTTIAGGNADYVWTTATSAMILLGDRNDTSKYAPVILTKTNNDKYAVIANGNNSYSKTTDVLPVSESDGGTSTGQLNLFNFTQTTRTYSVMVPFTTETGSGTASYTPGAFYLPFTSVATGEFIRIVLNGKVYLTDGIWAILDEDL